MISPISNTSTKKSLFYKGITNLSRSDKFLPVILLESAVTLGRTYQAYKRGGFIEARERFTEESIAAVFWLGGVSFFNKIGDTLGKKFFGLDKPAFDVGKDIMRDPISQINTANPKFSKNFLAGFKFAKVAASIIAATAVTGYALPIINQKITKKILQKQNTKKEPTINHKKQFSIPKKPFFGNTTIEEFKKASIKNKQAKQKTISFKAPFSELATNLAYNLEHHAVYKLLSTDVGLISGRMYNARNQHERLEIPIRDVSSIYFYMFATPHLIKFLNTLDTKYNPLTKLDIVSANHLHEFLNAKMQGETIDSSTFLNRFIGQEPKLPKEIKQILEANKGRINAEQLIPYLNDNKELIEKAHKMSKLQPALNGSRILSTQQVLDILNTGELTDPELLYRIYDDAFDKKPLFNKKAHVSTIQAPEKFIANSKIEDLRRKVFEFAKTIAKYADDKNNGQITPELLKKINTRNFARNGLYVGLGMTISAYFLSTVIPKVQYWVTKMRTGCDKFPGLMEIKDSKN